MLSVYTNQKELLKASSTSKVSRLESVDTGLLDVRNYSVTFKQGIQPNLEMHVYTPDGVYLTGNHNTLYSVENNNPALMSYLTRLYFKYKKAHTFNITEISEIIELVRLSNPDVADEIHNLYPINKI